MRAAHRILVVEPSRSSSEEIATHLRQDGHHVTVVHRGESALDAIAAARPALAIVDATLPDTTGTELLRRLRDGGRSARLPVIVLSERDDEVDRVVAFELGADDYIVRPCSMRELALRVRAILRRTREPAPHRRRDHLRLGPLDIDVPRHRATVDDRPLPLTPLEFRLLTHLASRAGRVQSREALLEEVWGQDGDAVTRAVDTSIKRLRRKLGPAGAWIETVRGVGYRMRDTPPPGALPDELCG